ncbi:YcxB family protein [Shewanella aestuarii]|uniref:YcxB family protein n=1 Tax=Shewanella aestuarii TaxID=1028752 RepID=A0A6G9QLF2_9GAMM|nr:YcxB family protein [Shewanella aestuarii]QIR15366.1 YcxB family protein [Shewanella aestuarii]
MMSKAANNTANITLNDQGINTLSKFVSHTILWTEVYRITESDNGFLIHLGKQQNYLSKRGLSDEALSFIRNKMH